MADSPVTAYMVVTTPATTVMGAIAERMKYRTDGIPSRSLARAVDSTAGGLTWASGSPRQVEDGVAVEEADRPEG
jgi:hypothetical protein